MAIKFKLISSFIFSLALLLLYLAFFTPEIKRTTISQSISLENLLKNES